MILRRIIEKLPDVDVLLDEQDNEILLGLIIETRDKINELIVFLNDLERR